MKTIRESERGPHRTHLSGSLGFAVRSFRGHEYRYSLGKTVDGICGFGSGDRLSY